MSTSLSHAKEVESDVIRTARGVGNNTITIATALDGASPPRNGSIISSTTTSSSNISNNERVEVSVEEVKEPNSGGHYDDEPMEGDDAYTTTSAQHIDDAMEITHEDEVACPQPVSKSMNSKAVESDVIQVARGVGGRTVTIAYAFEDPRPTVETADKTNVNEATAASNSGTLAEEEPAADTEGQIPEAVADEEVEEPTATEHVEDHVTNTEEEVTNEASVVGEEVAVHDGEPIPTDEQHEETAVAEEPTHEDEVASPQPVSNSINSKAVESDVIQAARGVGGRTVTIAYAFEDSRPRGDDKRDEPSVAIADEEVEEPTATEHNEEPAAVEETVESAAVADDEAEEPAAEESAAVVEEPVTVDEVATVDKPDESDAVNDDTAVESAADDRSRGMHTSVADEEAEEPAAIADEEAEEPAAEESAAVADEEAEESGEPAATSAQEDEQDNDEEPTPEVPTAQPPASRTPSTRSSGTPLSHHSEEEGAPEESQNDNQDGDTSQRAESATTGPSESPSGVVYKRHYPKGTYPRHTHSVPFTSARRQMHAKDRSVDPITGKQRREPSPFFVHAVPHRPPAKGSPSRHRQQQPSSPRTTDNTTADDDAPSATSTAARKAAENGSDHHRPSLTAISPRDAAAAAEKRKRKNNVFLLNVPSTQRAAVIIQHEAHRQTVENIVTNKIPRPPLIGTNLSARDYALSTKVGGSASLKASSTTTPRGTTTNNMTAGDPNLESPNSPRRRKAASDDRNPLSATGKYGVVTKHGRAVETIMSEDRRVQPRYFNKEDVIRGLPPNKRRQPRDATSTTDDSPITAPPHASIEGSKANDHSRSGSAQSVSSVSSVSSSNSSSNTASHDDDSDAERASGEEGEKKVKRENKSKKATETPADETAAPATSRALVPTKPAPKGNTQQSHHHPAFVTKIPALPVIRSNYASPRYNDTKKAMSKENIRLGRNIVMVKSTVPTAHQCRLVTIQKQDWAQQFRRPNYLLQPPPTVGRSKSKKTKQALAIEGPPPTKEEDTSGKQRSTSAASSSSSSSSSSEGGDALPPIAPSSAPAAPRSSAALQQQNRNSSASVKLPRVFVRGAPSSTQGPSSGVSSGGLVAMPAPTATQTVSPRTRPVQPREGGPGGGKGIIVVSAATGGLVPASRTEYNAVREHGWNCDATVVRTRRADLRLKLGGLVEEPPKPAHSVSPLVARSPQGKSKEGGGGEEGPAGGDAMIMDFQDEPEPATKGKEAVAQYKAWKVKENDRIKLRAQEIERIKNEKHVKRLQKKLHPVPPTKKTAENGGEVHEPQTGAPQPVSVGGVRMHTKANFTSCRKGNPCNKPEPTPVTTTELLVSEPTLAAGEATNPEEDVDGAHGGPEETSPAQNDDVPKQVEEEGANKAQSTTTHNVVTEESYSVEESDHQDDHGGALAPPSRTPSRRSSRSQSVDSRSSRSPSSHRSSSSSVSRRRSSASASRRSSAVASQHYSPAASRRSSSSASVSQKHDGGEGGDKADSESHNHPQDEEQEYGDEDFEEPVGEEEL